MKKLAIISTFDDLCGISGYTRALINQLSEDYAISVFDLDQALLRSTHRSVRQLGDQTIKGFAEKLDEFDYVNIQLEYGTLGSRNSDILRRFRWLSKNNKPLTVTFHTAMPRLASFEATFHALARLRFREAILAFRELQAARLLNYPIIKYLRARQKRARTSFIFHTRRDARDHQLIYGLERVYDHPLVFYAEDGPAAPELVEVPLPIFAENAKKPVLLGLFGFISPYKGVLTAVKAMRKLPDNYHLMIFGGVHPNEIKVGHSVHPYIQKIIGHVVHNNDDEPGDQGSQAKLNRYNFHFNGESLLPVISDGLHDISDRVHFQGVLNDQKFASAMRACDVVLLPYEEVGQSSSGPLAIAKDLGAKIVAARSKAFMQFAKYNPSSMHFFDIGNYLELARRIEMVVNTPAPIACDRYNVDTNRAVYRASFESDESGGSYFAPRIIAVNAGIDGPIGAYLNSQKSKRRTQKVSMPEKEIDCV